MKKKCLIAVALILALAGLLGTAHMMDFMGMMKKLHGG